MSYLKDSFLFRINILFQTLNLREAEIILKQNKLEEAESLDLLRLFSFESSEFSESAEFEELVLLTSTLLRVSSS